MFDVTWLVGCPRSGKTTRAIFEAHQRSRDRGGIPIIYLDNGEVHQFAMLPALRLEELCEQVWKAPRAFQSRFVPRDVRDVDAICSAVRAGGDVVFVVDEAAFWLTSRADCSSELLRVMRSTQHSRIEVLLTTQHFSGDVPQAAISCTDELFVFQCRSAAVLKRLEQDYGLPPEKVRTLGQGQAFHIKTGFQ